MRLRRENIYLIESIVQYKLVNNWEQLEPAINNIDKQRDERTEIINGLVKIVGQFISAAFTVIRFLH